MQIRTGLTGELLENKKLKMVEARFAFRQLEKKKGERKKNVSAGKSEKRRRMGRVTREGTTSGKEYVSGKGTSGSKTKRLRISTKGEKQ